MKKVAVLIITLLGFLSFPLFAFAYTVSGDVTTLSDQQYQIINAHGDSCSSLFDYDLFDEAGELGLRSELTCSNSEGGFTITDTGSYHLSSGHTYFLYYADGGSYQTNNFTYGSLTPTPTPVVKIVANPSSSDVTTGAPFNVDVKVEDSGAAFNAARATVAVSSNLSITGIHTPSTNACNLQYTQTPTTSNPSFAGAIFGGSSTGCTVYTLTLTPTSAGTGTITFTNGSIKSYADNSEILTGVTNGSFTITDGPTPTPAPNLSFTINNILPTYHSSYTLSGTNLDTLTHIFINGSEASSTYPTSTTWQNTQTLVLGDNNFAIYGSDNSNNQTATQTVTVNRHTLGDINGDGVVDLTDASLFAVDWDKTSNLTYNLSDMNDDGNVDLTDLSILAKLEL